MGTRHITKVINKEGKTVVANYGQWDGYPMGQGLDFLNMIHEDSELLKRLEKNLVGIQNITTDEELLEIYKKNDISISENGFFTIEESQNMFKILPELHRDTGITILKLISNNENIHLIFNESIEWVEYIYTIDFQKSQFIISSIGSKDISPIYSISLDNEITQKDLDDFTLQFDN